MKRPVVDSSALMALVKMESGAEVVAAALNDAVVSTVILAETLSKAANQGYPQTDVQDRLLDAGLSVEPLSMDDVHEIAKLHALALRGVSLADRCCLALAIRLGAPLLTADRAWRDLGLPVELRYIR